MAYVRQHGNQLAIVHGARHPETGKVEQKTLFTLYSRPEALEAIGKGREGSDRRFQSLLEGQYPEISFHWKAINRAIAKSLETLPPSYEYRAERLRGNFRRDLCAFARQIILADPQDLASAAQVIREHRHELAYLAETIRFRLQCCDKEPTRFSADNEYCWRFALSGTEVPGDAEDQAQSLYEKGKYDEAEAVFRLFHDAFGEYADGHNTLGLIAMQRRNLDQAIEHFKKTVEIGRRQFPKRISKKAFREDYRMRPYLRGLTNLASTLNQAGRFQEALAILEHLDHECGDAFTADSTRADIALNTGQWEEAAKRASRYSSVDPSQSLPSGLAFYEMGRHREAAMYALHGALNYPMASRMLHGLRAAEPRSAPEAEDWNLGVYVCRNLHAYLNQRSPGSQAFFRRLLKHPHLLALVDQVEAAEKHWEDDRAPSGGDGYKRMTTMRTLSFAQQEAPHLLDSESAKSRLDRMHGRNGTAHR